MMLEGKAPLDKNIGALAGQVANVMISDVNLGTCLAMLTS